MADLNGAGGTTLGGLFGSGAGQTQWWSVVLSSPPDRDPVPSVAPVLTFVADSWDNGTVDVQMQVADDTAFTALRFDSTTPNAAADGATPTSVLISGLTDGSTYYWRARTKKTVGGTTYTGEWTAAFTFTVDVRAGNATEYVNLNTGVEVILVPHGRLYVDANIGIEITLAPHAREYVNANYGMALDLDHDAWEYGHFGDVNTTTPTPHLWFLKPAAGRAGDGVQIVGWGFGDLQSTYGGQVEVDYGGDRGWETVPVVSWQTFPATAAAYGPDRRLDEVLGEIDMQHTVIGIIVPADAIPPGYPVRVRTEGP